MIHDNISMTAAIVCSLTSTLAIGGAAWLLLFQPQWVHDWPSISFLKSGGPLEPELNQIDWTNKGAH